MKARWFLRGMGVGIVSTALILCVTYRSNPKESNVIKEARELGMVFPENETGDISESYKQQAEELAQKNKDTTDKSSDKKTDAKAASGSAVSTKSKTDQEAKDKLDKSKKDISSASKYNKNKEKTFVVESGLVSSSVAKELKKAGIVDDAAAFDEYIVKKGYGKMLRSGKYKIPAGADYETIAKIITRQK